MAPYIFNIVFLLFFDIKDNVLLAGYEFVLGVCVYVDLRSTGVVNKV